MTDQELLATYVSAAVGEFADEPAATAEQIHVKGLYAIAAAAYDEGCEARDFLANPYADDSPKGRLSRLKRMFER